MTEEGLKELTILFVDDEPMQRVLMERVLSKHFKSVEVAEDGVQALELYNKNKNYDVILTDFTMPNMDGCQLLRNIKKLDSQQKIVILTGNDPKELLNEHDCKERTLRKPFIRESVSLLVDYLS